MRCSILRHLLINLAIVADWDQHRSAGTTARRVESQIGNAKPLPLKLSRFTWRVQMSRTFVLGAIMIAAAPLLLAQPALAGASASAPSKYSPNRQVAVAHQTRQTQKTDFAITEFSSSAKTTSPRK